MTVIGTPYADDATRVLLLGSGALGKEVAIELQRLGVEVIACDRYENAPAMQVADRSYCFSMLDGDELRRVIELEKPDYVVPEIEAIAKYAPIACSRSIQAGQPHAHCEQTQGVRKNSLRNPPPLSALMISVCFIPARIRSLEWSPPSGGCLQNVLPKCGGQTRGMRSLAECESADCAVHKHTGVVPDDLGP